MNHQISQIPTAKPPGAMIAAMESRESQQVQVAMMAAKRFPRDEKQCLDKILNSCCRENLASQAIYQFARGGTDIAGPSIRLAEAIAGKWGNVEYGWRELDRHKDESGAGVSSIECYAWDMETNTRVPRVFSVRHWRDTKQGGYAIKDERDVYELCANQAARRLRACILAVIPGDIVEEAMRQCDATLAASADTGPEAQKKIVTSFSQIGVTKAQIEGKIQRRMDSITAAQVITLRKIMSSLRDGMSSPEDWFEAPKAAATEEIDPFKKQDETTARPLAESAKLRKEAAAAAAVQPASQAGPSLVPDLANMPEQPWGDDEQPLL